METNKPTNGWDQYQRLVLRELEMNSSSIKDLAAEITILRVEIAYLKVKAGVWGLIAGAIPAVLLLVYTYIK